MSPTWKRRESDRPDPAKAERELRELRAETERVRAETQKYADLGREIRGIRQTNHLAEAFEAAALRRRRG